jgi:hypothetical protein
MVSVRTLLNTALLVTGIPLFASARGLVAATALPADSLLPVRVSIHAGEDITAELEDVETDWRRTRDHRRALVRLLKIARVKKSVWNLWGGCRLYNDLESVAAKLKLYPLVMKCHDRAVVLASLTEAGLFIPPDSSSLYLLTAEDTSLLVSGEQLSGVKSAPVRTREIWESFDDGKQAVSYAMLVHAKQPVPGRRKSYSHINNVGHLFITLIKYNADNSYVSRSFGFYPRKKGLFSATPVHPRSAAVFKDDALHDWDEVVGKFISPRKFQKIIGLLKEYDQLGYNLNKNNCTDFGLSVAAIGGISIRDTRGTWPLGSGNNPANAGQSLLEGKWSNTDEDFRGPVFVFNNVQSFPGMK